MSSGVAFVALLPQSRALPFASVLRIPTAQRSHFRVVCLGVECILRLSFACRPAAIGTTLASATYSCSCSRVCDLTCSFWRAIVTALFRVRYVINCSFCFNDGSLMAITKRSHFICITVYSQCIVRVCKSLTNSSTVSNEFCTRS